MTRSALLIPIFLFSSLGADDYDFDMESIETKTVEYAGYLRSQYKYQVLNEDSPSYLLADKTESSQNTYLNEAMFGMTYYKDDFRLLGSFSAKYNDIAGYDKSIFTIYQLYADNTLFLNNSIDVGKKRLKWGTGYFTNPAAFLDRPKDPTQPENLYEGYVLANYTYNKSFEGDLKNLKLDIVYMPTSSEVNSDLYDGQSINLAAKLYLLYFDTDIELIYLYNDPLKDKVGLTFSRNIESHFEVHGEFAQEIEGYTSYLLGLRYATENDISIISEYFYNSRGLDKEEIASAVATKPYAAKRYIASIISKKEPFDIVYSSLYFRDIFDIEDQSHADTLGLIYTFKFNLMVDLSYTMNTGDPESEYGKKMISDFLWIKATWYY